MYLQVPGISFPPFVYTWESRFQTSPMQPTIVVRKRIAIVGGGTGGLAALKTFIYDIPKVPGEIWDVVLYEQRSDVGGVWLEDPRIPHEPLLPETPLYPRLHTNTPHPTMAYPGFPFPPMTPLFPSHKVVQMYHADYAQHFNLNSYIKLNHTVSSALWVGSSTDGYWDVSTRTGYPTEIIPGNSSSPEQDVQEESTERFDHLVIATGHNHYPKFPRWAINNNWIHGREGRRIVHSIYYREPRDYQNKVVLVVGAGSSGIDIASQIREYAEKTYHSFKSGRIIQSFENIVRKPRTSHLTQTSVVFEDGSEASDVDIIILATGYENRFPFLCSSDPYATNSRARHGLSVLSTDPRAKSRSNSDRIVTNLDYVFPVGRQIVSLSLLHPLNALTFVGMPLPIANAPSDILQSLFIGHLIANRDSLFSGEEDAVRQRLLDQLSVYEHQLEEQGYDPYVIGQKLVGENNTEVDYQEELYSFMKSRGIVPEDGKKYVEEWRIKGRSNALKLKAAWKVIERQGDAEMWLEGVRTEEEWADLLERLVESCSHR